MDEQQLDELITKSLTKQATNILKDHASLTIAYVNERVSNVETRCTKDLAAMSDRLTKAGQLYREVQGKLETLTKDNAKLAREVYRIAQTTSQGKGAKQDD